MQQELDALAELFAPLLAEFCETSFIKSLADFNHQIVVEPQVMHNGQALTEHFSRLEQVTHISAAVVLANRTMAMLINRLVI